MTEINSLEHLAAPTTATDPSPSAPSEPSAPGSSAPGFASLKKEINEPLKNFLGNTEKLLEQAKALDLQMFKLDLQEIQTTAKQLLTLLESPPKRQVPTPAPAAAEPVMTPKLMTRRARTVHNRGTILIVDDHQVFQALVGQLLSEEGYDLMSAQDG